MDIDPAAVLAGAIRERFGPRSIVPAGRGSLGLMATMIDWVRRGGVPRVALCANVCHDVVAAVLAAGCSPVFCDIDPRGGGVPIEEWRRARDAGASVALVVHLYGNPADLAPIRAVFPAPECLLIDDAAQALGSETPGGAWVGAAGDVGLLSFGPTKHIECGGALLLFTDPVRAERVSCLLDEIPAEPADRRGALEAEFRNRLHEARQRLHARGAEAAGAFSGLLDGYGPCLQVGPAPDNAQALAAALRSYPQAMSLRHEKVLHWAQGLAAVGLRAVGMGVRTVAWRYACRLPGIDWAVQNRLGNQMRAAGVNVSHWYLPAHWMCGFPVGSLPGVERLSGEIFEFWVDAGTSLERIDKDAAVVSRIVKMAPDIQTTGVA